MNPPPLQTTPGRNGGPALSKLRCARHDTREAAARCSKCGMPFCRECVSDHEGRLLCAACLAKLIAEQKNAATAKARGGATTTIVAILKRATTIAAGAMWLWFCFYLVGLLIKKTPQTLHEGTVWKQAVDEKEERK